MRAPGSNSMAAESSDARLIDRAERGDAEAGNLLALRYRQATYLLALQLTRHPDDALDIAQEALLRFFRSLTRFDRRRPVRPWLMQIVRNLVRDRGRRRKVRREETGSVPAAEMIREPADTGLNPEQRAVKQELQAQLWRLVGGLTPPYREILVLRDYQGLAYQEISVLLDIPLGTVMSRLHKARALLRDAWHSAPEGDA
ncbi:MAG: sigma-70 family RNA polymerase sigma factor [Acidobacteria bacterium]|nr:sigma-70 family RNA polymerase sigma factor [Acidobacteriota bacterium]